MSTASVDIDYALSELATAIKAQTNSAAANAISRAMDALERVKEALAISERNELSNWHSTWE